MSINLIDGIYGDDQFFCDQMHYYKKMEMETLRMHYIKISIIAYHSRVAYPLLHIHLNKILPRQKFCLCAAQPKLLAVSAYFTSPA